MPVPGARAIPWDRFLEEIRVGTGYPRRDTSNETEGERISQHLHQAYERSSRQYNKRAREFHVKPGQEVFRRNFTLSDFGKNYNAKFARKFARCRIRRPVGNNMFELEDLAGKPIGIYHAKDLRL
ncbi:uncharacterized protein LOC120457844 [Drosophila santomea]|uniref:uncharacterized protein LOC120457844 n=1 Tax=Drosophila santomea TaxID=129105 RepID=UPI00195328DC|nr:uncharacterized protein LOC120457844 [Drosophila santomea]